MFARHPKRTLPKGVVPQTEATEKNVVVTVPATMCTIVVAVLVILLVVLWGMFALRNLGGYVEWTIGTYAASPTTPIAFGLGLFFLGLLQEDMFVLVFVSLVFLVFGCTTTLFQLHEMYTHGPWDVVNKTDIWMLQPVVLNTSIVALQHTNDTFYWEAVFMWFASISTLILAVSELVLLGFSVYDWCYPKKPDTTFNMSPLTFAVLVDAGVWEDGWPNKPDETFDRMRCDGFGKEFCHILSKKALRGFPNPYSFAIGMTFVGVAYGAIVLVETFSNMVDVMPFRTAQPRPVGFFVAGPGDDFPLAFVIAARLGPIFPLGSGSDDCNHRMPIHLALFALSLFGFGVFTARAVFAYTSTGSFDNPLNYFTMVMQPFVVGGDKFRTHWILPLTQEQANLSGRFDSMYIGKWFLGVFFIFLQFGELCSLAGLRLRRPNKDEINKETERHKLDLSTVLLHGYDRA